MGVGGTHTTRQVAHQEVGGTHIVRRCMVCWEVGGTCIVGRRMYSGRWVAHASWGVGKWMAHREMDGMWGDGVTTRSTDS